MGIRRESPSSQSRSHHPQTNRTTLAPPVPEAGDRTIVVSLIQLSDATPIRGDAADDHRPRFQTTGFKGAPVPGTEDLLEGAPVPGTEIPVSVPGTEMPDAKPNEGLPVPGTKQSEQETDATAIPGAVPGTVPGTQPDTEATAVPGTVPGTQPDTAVGTVPGTILLPVPPGLLVCISPISSSEKLRMRAGQHDRNGPD